MSVRIQCPKCGAQRSVNRRLMGRQIRCPECDGAIQVPTVSDKLSSIETDFADAVEVEEKDMVEMVDVVEVSPPTSKSSREFDDLRSLDNPAESESDEEDGDAEESDSDEAGIAFAKRELPKDDMDMTPMVDVTFLLLIFFMITASFSREKVIEEPPPLSDTASIKKEEPEKVLDTVRVQVDEFNAYTIILPGGEDRQASSKQDLLLALDEARREIVTGSNDDALKMAVEAHVSSIHAAVVAALDAGRDKGFSSFQVTVVEEFE